MKFSIGGKSRSYLKFWFSWPRNSSDICNAISIATVDFY